MKVLLLLLLTAVSSYGAYATCWEAGCDVDSRQRCYLGRDSYYCEDRNDYCGTVAMHTGDVCMGPPENLVIVEAAQFQGVLGQGVWMVAFIWGTLIFIAFSTRMRV